MSYLKDEIEKFESVKRNYLGHTKQIDSFIRMVDGQKDFLKEHDKEQEDGKNAEFFKRMRSLNNSTVQYNAVIISIYGSYEFFVDELLKSYLAYLKSVTNLYSDYPKQLKKKNYDKTIEYLSNPGRFQNMGLVDTVVISNIEQTYVQGISSKTTDALLLSHGGNLTTTQLGNLFHEFGFCDIIPKLKKNNGLKKFARSKGLDGDIIQAKGFSLLDIIVSERNKVAHGWIIDDRISFGTLLDTYVPFMEQLCIALCELIISQLIQDAFMRKEIYEFSPILHLWEQGTVIGVNNGLFRLKVGENLYYSDGEWYYYTVILNLQNDKKDKSQILVSNKDITIQVKTKFSKHYRIFGYYRSRN